MNSSMFQRALRTSSWCLGGKNHQLFRDEDSRNSVGVVTVQLAFWRGGWDYCGLDIANMRVYSRVSIERSRAITAASQGTTRERQRSTRTNASGTSKSEICWVVSSMARLRVSGYWAGDRPAPARSKRGK